MKPPPPRLPALGWVTASAKAVATAASTAFPPRARTDAPTSEASPETETTTPRRDATTPVSRAWVADGCAAAADEIATTYRRVASDALEKRCEIIWRAGLEAGA